MSSSAHFSPSFHLKKVETVQSSELTEIVLKHNFTVSQSDLRGTARTVDL